MKDRHTVFNTSCCVGLSSYFNCITSRYLKEPLNRAYCIDLIDFDLTVLSIFFIKLTSLEKKRKQISLCLKQSSPIQEYPVFSFLGF